MSLSIMLSAFAGAIFANITTPYFIEKLGVVRGMAVLLAVYGFGILLLFAFSG